MRHLFCKQAYPSAVRFFVDIGEAVLAPSRRSRPEPAVLLISVPFIPRGYDDCRRSNCSRGTPFRTKIRAESESESESAEAKAEAKAKGNRMRPVRHSQALLDSGEAEKLRSQLDIRGRVRMVPSRRSIRQISASGQNLADHFPAADWQWTSLYVVNRSFRGQPHTVENGRNVVPGKNPISNDVSGL